MQYMVTNYDCSSQMIKIPFGDSYWSTLRRSWLWFRTRNFATASPPRCPDCQTPLSAGTWWANALRSSGQLQPKASWKSCSLLCYCNYQLFFHENLLFRLVLVSIWTNRTEWRGHALDALLGAATSLSEHPLLTQHSIVIKALKELCYLHLLAGLKSVIG